LLITIEVYTFAVNFKKNNLKEIIMIIVPVKEGENIDRALKKFKRKFEKTGVVRELRRRQAFTKPSIVTREQLIRAAYKQKLQNADEI
jgi:small subunit ribosomal protein S21